MARLSWQASRTARASVVVLGPAVAWLSLVGSLTTWTVAPLAAGWRPYVVMSDSMRPSVAAGDVVLVSELTDAAPPRRGDVALVADDARPDGTRLHRVVRVLADGRVVTQGDANAGPDAAVPVSDVLGRARMVVPGIGLPRVWLARGQGVAAVAAGVGTLLALLTVLAPPVQGPRRGTGAARHRRGPSRHPVPAGAVSVLLVLVLVAVQPAAPGYALWTSTVTTANALGAGAWMGYTWTVTNDGAPASWWRLNDSTTSLVAAPAAGTVSGTYFRDPSATFRTATGVNTAVPPAAPSRNGAQGLAARAGAGKNQVGQDVAFGDVYGFTGNTPFSVEIWFRQTARCATCAQRIVSKEEYTSETSRTGWYVTIFPDNGTEVANWLGVARVLDGTFTWAPWPTPVALNTWYHVVGTYDGTTLSLYVDGKLVSTSPSTVSLRATTKPLRVGDLDAGTQTNSHFVGDVDEFAVYTSVLTARQVRAHYLAGAPAA